MTIKRNVKNLLHYGQVYPNPSTRTAVSHKEKDYYTFKVRDLSRYNLELTEEVTRLRDKAISDYYRLHYRSHQHKNPINREVINIMSGFGDLTTLEDIKPLKSSDFEGDIVGFEVKIVSSKANPKASWKEWALSESMFKPEGEKKVNYTFETSSNEAINFTEISKELSSQTPVLLVSVEQTKSTKEKTELSKLKGELTVLNKELGKKYKKGEVMNGEDTESIYVLDDAIDELKFVDRAYYILVHEQLIQKLYNLVENNHNAASNLLSLLSDNMISVDAEDISEVKADLQTCVDAKWGSGYRASVEVKALL